eukprot:m.230723 g.230723  ORF g.230723 m.230723 type:complete len:51 (+) comp17354_c0_seq7:3105-3257(+)
MLGFTDTEDDHAKPNFDDKNKQQFRSKSKGPGSDVECYKCHQVRDRTLAQ